jgi:hypothetical protein
LQWCTIAVISNKLSSSCWLRQYKEAKSRSKSSIGYHAWLLSKLLHRRCELRSLPPWQMAKKRVDNNQTIDRCNQILN